MTAIESTRTEEHITLLDVYAENGVREVTPRVDALATISAGAKAKNASNPTINRDGTISLHDPEGRASGLAATLAASGGKVLTIAFPFNDWDSVVQMRFAEYSASRLLCFGDQHSITEITDKGERKVHPAGTPEYDALRKRCKVTVNVYFVLAAWDLKDPQGGSMGPGVLFPDGLGFYRLRFTSRNSLDNLLNTWKLIKKMSGDRISGVPLDLQLVNREVSGPDGKRRNVPVWTFTMKPPQGLQLTSRNFQATLSQALKSGEELMLPAPDGDEIDAAFEVITPDQDEAPALTERQTRELTNGFNAAAVRTKYFAITNNTPYAHQPGRARLITAVTAYHYQGDTEHVTDSLSEVLNRADQALADVLLASAEAWAAGWEAQCGAIRRAYSAAKTAGKDTDALSTEFDGWRTDEEKAAELLDRLQALTA
ncbi:hypothetical protein [Deinococcus multiflagellatus]|uniref:Uncharacterized protein n=1 Tax=Deinococcus multiflagellatus TaxID=1656887 RepID=A0ABW1ZEQ1_9DEIO|nr:hypothetical protein [Deinococcus multiflagellatus]MBZ9712222.1 hypothetical protein [Deinococcus multiflagellatus]